MASKVKIRENRILPASKRQIKNIKSRRSKRVAERIGRILNEKKSRLVVEKRFEKSKESRKRETKHKTPTTARSRKGICVLCLTKGHRNCGYLRGPYGRKKNYVHWKCANFSYLFKKTNNTTQLSSRAVLAAVKAGVTKAG